MSDPIRLLVADDHPVVRDGLIAILGTQADFAVVGAAATGIEVVQQVAVLEPDVILLDLAMPELDGVAAIRQVRATHPAVGIVVFTAFDTDERILDAVRAGAQGYLLKGAPREEIFNAIRVVYGGGSLLQPLVASRLLQQVREAPDAGHAPHLTPREHDVLRLLAQGLQNKEIAASLAISERTVKFHVSTLLEKLGAGNRTEAVALATQQGLVKRETLKVLRDA
jgi:DNA-binding NarL/FixJ family response regulator